MKAGTDERLRDPGEMYVEGPSLKVARFHHACVSVDGTAIVLGGYGAHAILSSIEIRNKTSGEWTLYEAKLPAAMAGFGAYSMKDPLTDKYQVGLDVARLLNPI